MHSFHVPEDWVPIVDFVTDKWITTFFLDSNNKVHEIAQIPAIAEAS